MALEWEGITPFDSRLSFALRGAESREALQHATWQVLPDAFARNIALSAGPHRWWQYRATFAGGRAAWSSLQRVRIVFEQMP